MTQKRPNFLVILADDLGFSDVGCFGSEIHTPNLDKLAREGTRFSDYHTASACSPTRSILLNGTDAHLAGLGVMYEFIASSTIARDPERWNKPGHEGYLNHDVAALPEVLQDAGYHTLLSGKWHLGFKEGFIPAGRVFDKSWALLPGCSNHFGWEPAYDEAGRPKVVGHHPPLCVDQATRYMVCMIFFERVGSKVNKTRSTPNKTNSPDGFYSSQFYVDNLLRYFHEPVLRLQRLENLKKLGLIPKDVDPAEVVANGAKNGEEMSVWEKKIGMVHAMDRDIGKVVDYLEKNGELDNTVVIFMSDNGAEGAALVSEATPTMGPRLLETIDKYYDNSYENLGNHNSFIWYGPQWSQASTAPNRLMKAFSTEGPSSPVVSLSSFSLFSLTLVIRRDQSTYAHPIPGLQSPSSRLHSPPAWTLCPLSSTSRALNIPTSPTERVPYRGHQVYPVSGKSWVPDLRDGHTFTDKDGDESEAVHGENDHPVGWELHARAALRKDRWKIVNQPLGEHGTGGWELYDLSTDRGEKHYLAQKLPDKLKELVADWGRYEEETGTVFGLPIKHVRGHGELIRKENVSGDVVEDQKA
ncbi:hypothetical protein L198_06944 [Cryptococcus wingfieldii CBS 7118]|uniref:Sulfatase N-terminal domain-containing protein n=1 Tax=Cryptococcus wingfieldii CBS 7118 TaxID=1295528 RepID=A0A1E3IIF7_9TREE|nr:hypothetical protein L198_06944 [Cryptococcus wingfieldii CBS 7118]ODN87716.1 hypothetical protein L198_06944 [Cryptococcus wingfieldii CBS 7118]